jgi:glutamine synthetase
VESSSEKSSKIGYVLKTVEERKVNFIQLWFSDILGTPKSFQITPAELENALQDGMTFDGSAIDGFSRIQESDVIALPDPTTFTLMPSDPSVASVFCDIYNLDLTPFEGCPRNTLRRALDRAHKLGYTFFAAPEIEYFYFDTHIKDGPVPLDNGSYFELTVANLPSQIRKKTVLALEDMGIPVEYSQHEDAPSQHEIDLRYTDALSMADNVMTARVIIKEIAAAHGILASFMPKPISGVQGSGMHTHFSLFKGNSNAFYDEEDPYQLSEVAKRFIAGVLHNAPAMTAITNQWVNSYKRLVVGYEAPTYVSWAQNNRSALVRVPKPKSNNPDSTRFEYRAIDPGVNPYLGFAAILGAGLDGIENGYELPSEVQENLYKLSPEEVEKYGILSLPGNLDEAVKEMERSTLMREILGEHVFEWFIRNKRDEWSGYKTHVSQFEIDRYLERL